MIFGGEDAFQPRMCHGPLTAALGTSSGLSTALTIGSTIFSVISSVSETSAANDAAEFNAQVAKRNADIAKQQSERDAEQADRDRRLRLGANLAAGGANNLGQPLDILRDNAAQEELNILNLEQQGILNENAFLTDAALERSKKKSVFTGVGTSILAGGSKIVDDKRKLGGG